MGRRKRLAGKDRSPPILHPQISLRPRRGFWGRAAQTPRLAAGRATSPLSHAPACPLALPAGWPLLGASRPSAAPCPERAQLRHTQSQAHRPSCPPATTGAPVQTPRHTMQPLGRRRRRAERGAPRIFHRVAERRQLSGALPVACIVGVATRLGVRRLRLCLCRRRRPLGGTRLGCGVHRPLGQRHCFWRAVGGGGSTSCCGFFWCKLLFLVSEWRRRENVLG